MEVVFVVVWLTVLIVMFVWPVSHDWALKYFNLLKDAINPPAEKPAKKGLLDESDLAFSARRIAYFEHDLDVGLHDKQLCLWCKYPTLGPPVRGDTGFRDYTGAVLPPPVLYKPPANRIMRGQVRPPGSRAPVMRKPPPPPDPSQPTQIKM